VAQDEPGAATRPVSYFTVENNFLPAARGIGVQAAEFLAVSPKAAAVMRSAIDKSYKTVI
jgi:hypothetical protein